MSCIPLTTESRLNEVRKRLHWPAGRRWRISLIFGFLLPLRTDFNHYSSCLFPIFESNYYDEDVRGLYQFAVYNRFKRTFLNNESKHPCNQSKQHLRRETAVQLQAAPCCIHVEHVRVRGCDSGREEIHCACTRTQRMWITSVI